MADIPRKSSEIKALATIWVPTDVSFAVRTHVELDEAGLGHEGDWILEPVPGLPGLYLAMRVLPERAKDGQDTVQL